jgi:hypothetical protein
VPVPLIKEKTKSEAFPQHLLNPPGLVGDIMRYSLASSLRPQPILSLMAGLAAVSGISNNCYQLDKYGTRLNFYGISVAPTGAGKDRPAKVAAECMRVAGRVTRSGAASGAAIISSLAESPTLGLWIDEAWQMIESINSSSGSNHQKELGRVLMELYGSSSSSYDGKIYAKAVDNISSVERPYVVFTGATTPLRFAEVLTGDQVSDGFLNRLVVFKSDEIPSLTECSILAMPHSIKSDIEGIASRLSSSDVFDDPNDPNSSLGVSSMKPITIPITDKARSLIIDHNNASDNKLRKANALSPLWARAPENAMKIAGILAVGIDDVRPVVDDKLMQFAIDLINHCVTDLSGDLAADMGKSDFSKLADKALGYIVNARDYSDDQRYGDFTSQGYMPKAKFNKLMRVKPREVKEVVDYLLDSGQIQVVKSDLKGGTKVTTCYAPS